mmetsp:Transcript_4289/g.10354  ORF Transcript_4289/g.10354 Transcript_4289/m.10354 type:complete len:98 (-) Transcript_4289:1136-1429(-)
MVGLVYAWAHFIDVLTTSLGQTWFLIGLQKAISGEFVKGNICPPRVGMSVATFKGRHFTAQTTVTIYFGLCTFVTAAFCGDGIYSLYELATRAESIQ